MFDGLNSPAVRRLVEAALEEDRVWEDITTSLLIPCDLESAGAVLVKEEAVLAGLPLLRTVFHLVDENVAVELLRSDGEAVPAGTVAARVRGRSASLLRAERVAINFLQRLSGVATLTARFVAAVRDLPHPPRIADTRKTTPGLRLLEKYAVRMGGGANHRASLAEAILVKDNHLALLRRAGISLREAVAAARRAAPHTVFIEVEAKTMEEAEDAVEAGADAVLLDNMTPAQLAAAVERIGRRAVTEASGGVSLENIRAVAAAGVDIVSIGALTHSARAIDISLEIE